jgi:hypothetical protein
MLEMAAEAGAAPALPNLIFGPLAVLAGVVIVVFRDCLYRATVRGQEQFLGKSGSAALSRLQSAFWVGAAGVGVVLMGVAMISHGIWAAVSTW